MDVKTIAYISQGKDLIKINKTMLFNPLNLSKNKKYIRNRSGKERCESYDTFIEQVCYENSTDESNVSIHLVTPTYVYDLSRGSMMAKLEQHSHAM